MIIKTYVKGPIGANNYLLIDESEKDAVMIDCSASDDSFINEIRALGINLKAILLTHGHFDHIMGCDKFHEEFGVPIYVGKEDEEQIIHAPEMTEMLGGIRIPDVTSVKNYVSEGDIFKLGDTELKAISTPGHTKGGMCYLTNDGKLFSGDTLFYTSVGRTDFMGGSWQEIVHSVKDKLFNLPDDTKVFPGHGSQTTIGFEKNNNEIL